TTPGLHAGDVIQIEPNSNPGTLQTADIPAIKNLAIQGDPASDVQSIPSFVADSVKIGAAQQGFTLKNVQVDIQNGSLQFTADGTITGCRITNDFDGTCMSLLGTSAFVISNSYIQNANARGEGDLLDVQPVVGSHNQISDNKFVALTGNVITPLS